MVLGKTDNVAGVEASLQTQWYKIGKGGEPKRDIQEADVHSQEVEELALNAAGIVSWYFCMWQPSKFAAM